MASVFPTFRASAIFDRATTLKRGARLAIFAAGVAVVMLLAGPSRAQEAVTPAAVAGVAEQVADGAAAAQPAAQPATPAITPATTADVAKQAADPHRFMFNFDHQPWKAVLEQFARQANLSLTMDSPPPGTFNFSDTRRYTEIEALDVLNRVLYTTKGYLLVKHDNMLLLVDMDANEVAPALIPDVPLDQLDQHGDYELVRVIYPVWNMTAEQAGEQVKQLLGPKMKVVTLPQSRQVQVTELVERQKTIRRIIDAGNQPGPGGFRPFPLKYITADAALPVLRQSLGIVKGADVTPDGNPPNTQPSVRLTRSAVGNVLLFQGTPEGSARLEALLKLIDVPDSGLEMARQTEVYSLGTLDGKKTLDVLEEMYRGNPNVSFVEDATTNTLSAVAPPAAQASIKATIEMLQKDARTVEIIPLTRLDPVSAKSIVSNIFGGAGTTETPNPNGVAVDYDAQQRVLIVRGTRSQIAQVRQVLTQLGENSQAESSGMTARDKIRVLPYSQSAALSAIRQIEQFMPSMGDRIRIVAPPKGIPVRRPYNSLEPLPSAPQNQPASGARGEQTPGIFQRFEGRGGTAAPKAAPAPSDRETQVAPDREPRAETDDSDVAKSQPTPSTAGAQVRFVAQQSATEEPSQPKQAAAQTPPNTTKSAAEPKKPVLVVPGPNGLVVVSEDLSALDELEQLLTLVAPVTSSTEREFAVFYLQYATADSAAGVLSSLYGGSGAARGGGRGGRGGGNLVDQLTGQLVQQLAGGAGDAISGLLGGGFSSASVDIVPLVDKNAVLVRAKPTDLDSIGQIIEIIDQRSGPIEDQSDPDPKRIQVNNISASDMAAMIQAIYADRIATPGGGQQDIFRQLTGGGGAEQQQQKMTIYADNRNNQLIVRAPSALYEKVAAMVADLDVSNDIPEITKVVPLSQASMSSIKIALDPIAAAAQNATNNNQPNNNNQNNNQLQQLQQFQQMQALLGNRGGGNRGGGGNQAAGGRGGGRGGGAGNAGGGGGGGLNALQGLIGGGRGGGGGGNAGGGGAGGGRGGGGGGRGGGRGG